jgi:hypothetical protein
VVIGKRKGAVWQCAGSDYIRAAERLLSQETQWLSRN